MKYDVFISYRREGGYDTAKHLYDLLVRDGYKVSFDIDTLRNDDFDIQLLSRIEQCKDFILIVDAHCFDKILDKSIDPKKDWLRCELAHALKHNKNIIPIFLSGVTGFPDGLPEDIVNVTKKNGPEYNRYYFNDFYNTLKKRFLKSKKKSKGKYILLLSLVLFLTYILFNLEIPKPLNGERAQKMEAEVNRAEVLNKFCGTFSIVSPGYLETGITHIYSMQLDPVNSSCEWIEDGIIHITNSKGWCGTMIKGVEVWDIINFSLHKSYKYAIVDMRRVACMFSDGITKTCKLKLELDDYDNIIMTYISGNEAPSPLVQSNGSYGNAIFVRD